MVRRSSASTKARKDKEFHQFRDNMDGWIKDINTQMGSVVTMGSLLQENASNIQHNYEIMRQLAAEIEDLKNEVETLKLMQIISLNKQDIVQKRTDA